MAKKPARPSAKPAQSVNRTESSRGGKPAKEARAGKRAGSAAETVRLSRSAGSPGGAGGGKKKKTGKRSIQQYDHRDKKRVNNPPVGLVTPDTDPIDSVDAPEGSEITDSLVNRKSGGAGAARKTYQYDPHLDPQLQWAGKAERLSFEVPTVSLHVHERIDPKTIIEAVRAKNGPTHPGEDQPMLFGMPEENPPLRDAVEFYRHKHNWTNRLIAGDSLLVMNSLLEKEGLGGQVQMVYIDPPYGIRYGSNFQPFTNKRDVKDGADDDLTQEPEMLKAFRDTWELGIHSYLTYLRDRLLLAKDLLHESGSCFVQISDENIHHVREMLDEVFGSANFIGLIVVTKTGSLTGELLSSVADYILWYGRDKTRIKYRKLFDDRAERDSEDYSADPLKSDGFRKGTTFDYTFEGTKFECSQDDHWKVTKEGLDRLALADRLVPLRKALRFKRFWQDFPVKEYSNIWHGMGGASNMVYVVQTSPRILERCILMTTDPGDLVLDPTCGSGTTAFVAEAWGRRWITTDTSRVAITLAKQRLMTGVFDYYALAHAEQGVGSGFKYRTVPHVTLKSIANNPEIKPGMSEVDIDRAIAKYADSETLYDQPEKDKGKARVTGPFTVEAVPAAMFGQPAVRGVDPIDWDAQAALPGMADANTLQPIPAPPDASIARSGETLRQSEWRAELHKTGIRAKNGEKIEFVRVEALPGTRWISADAETKEAKPRRAVVVFGPEHAPLEQRQVTSAIEEASHLVPQPKMVIFAALQFDPEAAKDIDQTNWPGVTLLKAQMNGDLVTDDLKKKRSSNESFWLVGQPDVSVRTITKGDHKGKHEVEIHGFDYYNPKSGTVDSGGTGDIAMWLLDTDYDLRSLFARQVFFPMAGPKDGWARLAKNLKAEIDPDLIEQYRGTKSLPFEAGKHKRIAVKIVDARGIESLRVMELT